MLSANKFFHDRLVLLLLSVNSFLAVLGVLSVLFRLQGGGDNFIVQYRAQLGISAFKPGSVSHVLAFAGFALLVLIVHTLLSWQVYHIKRQLAVLILALGSLLLVINLIVSNALLTLR
jgi:hypothetical protein